MTHVEREKIEATDEQIEDFFDKLGYGLKVEDLCFGLAEEMNEFRAARKNWVQPGYLNEDSDLVLEILDASAVKGQTKRNVVLIRFGKYCAIYGADM